MALNGEALKHASSIARTKPEPFIATACRYGSSLSLGGLLLAIGLLVGLNPGGLRDRLLGNKTPTIHSLAVLPLQSLGDDPKQEYFAEGVTDALITDLAQISALRVVSRTTIMRYGKPDKPLSQIARELNVDGIVEGTVQRSGDRVRITAQLIYGPADQHLWANSFERDVKDVLDLQSTVANEIAGQIKVKVTPKEQARFKNLRPVNPKALDAYLEARYHIDQCQNLAFYKDKNQTIREEARKAASFLDEAVREDPNYLPAYVTYFDVIDHVDIPLQEYSSKVHAALSKALELDETNVPTHLALAKLLMEYDYNWAGAEREYKRAVEIDPRSADAHAAYAEYLDNVEGLTDSGGDRPDAKKERDLAQALDPVHDYLADAGQERMGRTLDEQRQAVEQKAPNDPFSLGVMGKDYAIAGRFQDAVEMYERCLTLYGWHDMAAVMKRANAQRGPRYALEEWMRAGEEYQKKHGDMPLVPMAFSYASLGNRDGAFAWLDKAVEQRNWMIIYLKRDKVWDPLRSDPRFAALLRRVGLPQ
jgi:TolB-like protein